MPGKTDRHPAALYVLVLTLCATAVSLAFRLPNADVGWVVEVGLRMARGATLYVDVIDVHPPLLFWCAAATGWLSDRIGADPLALYWLLIVAHVLASLALVRALTRDWASPAAASVALLLLPAGGFGEGEQLFAAGLIPYLLLAAKRIRTEPVPRWLAIACGVLLALGICRKPYLALGWLAVEAFVRRPRVELSALLATGAAYLALVGLFAPQYWPVAKMAAQGYGAFYPSSPWAILIHGPGPLIALWLGVLAWRARSIVDRMAAASGAALVLAVVLQGHGFGYHWLPALAVALFGLLRWLLPNPLACAAIAPVVAFASVLTVTMQDGLREWPYLLDRTTAVVAEHGGPVMALGTLMHITHPLAVTTGVLTTSRFPTHWMLGAAYEDRGPMRAPEAMGGLERWAFDGTVEDFTRGQPAVLFVEASGRFGPLPGWDWLAYFGQDRRFRAALRGYTEVRPVENFRVFVR